MNNSMTVVLTLLTVLSYVVLHHKMCFGDPTSQVSRFAWASKKKKNVFLVVFFLPYMVLGISFFYFDIVFFFLLHSLKMFTPGIKEYPLKTKQLIILILYRVPCGLYPECPTYFSYLCGQK